MSIPMSFAVDIAGKEVLTLNAVVEELKFVEEKENIFTDFPIGTTIQDGGKREKSVKYITIEYLGSSLLEIIIIDYQTSKLQYNY